MEEHKWNVYTFRWDVPGVKHRRVASDLTREEAFKIAYEIMAKGDGRIGAYIADKIHGDEQEAIW